MENQEEIEYAIFLSDFTKEAKKDIAEKLGYFSVEECVYDNNWDIYPITVVVLPKNSLKR